MLLLCAMPPTALVHGAHSTLHRPLRARGNARPAVLRRRHDRTELQALSLDDGTRFTLPRLNTTETETKVAVRVYRVISEEVRERSGDILIEMASLGDLPTPPEHCFACMRCRTAVPAALLSARRRLG